MASSDARDAELARLSGSELVERLRTTCRLADYEAAARVLDARDRRLALAEAKEGLDARDRRLAKAEAALAEAKEGLDARDVRLAKAEAALAEAKAGLDARDRSVAQMQEDLATALAKVGALREKYGALKDAPRGPVNEDARRRPRNEAARPGDAIAAPAPAPRGERRAELAEEKGPVVIDLCSSDEEEKEEREREGCRLGASGVFRKRKATASEVSDEGRRAMVSWKSNTAASACSSDDEDDTLTLSQLMKKKRDGAQPGADEEPKNADSVRPMGVYLPEISLVIKEEATEATVGGSDEPNVANFVQGRGNVESEGGGGMSRAMPSPQPLGSAVGNSSKKNPSRANSAGLLGIDLPGISLVIKKEAIEATVGGSDEPKVANFVQGRGNVKSRGDGGMSRAMPSPQPFDSAVGNSSEKNFSMANRVGVRTAWKEGSLGNDLPKTPVITERPEIRVVGSELKVASFVHGRGNGKSADHGVSRAPPPGFAARTGSLPRGFAARTGSQKNLSKADQGGPRIAGKDDSFAGQEEDSLAQARNPSLSKKIVESGRAGAVSPKGHTGSALSGNMVLGLDAIREQEKTNGLGHKGNVMPVTNGIGKQRGKLRSCQSREISDGGHLRTSDKQLGSATLPPQNELHSGQTTVESSLPLAVTRNWKYEADVFTSCIENKELCMQAACALYRQKKMFQSTEGGRSGSSGLCKSDAHRVAKLVEYLLDGDVQGPLKRTAEELVKHDPTGPSILEKVVCQFYEQLFYIYKNKEDPYFC